MVPGENREIGAEQPRTLGTLLLPKPRAKARRFSWYPVMESTGRVSAKFWLLIWPVFRIHLMENKIHSFHWKLKAEPWVFLAAACLVLAQAPPASARAAASKTCKRSPARGKLAGKIPCNGDSGRPQHQEM